jgi:hypothetical protein
MNQFNLRFQRLLLALAIPKALFVLPRDAAFFPTLNSDPSPMAARVGAINYRGFWQV